MATVPTTERMSADQSAVLAEFARTCKAAVRSVSLYPATHPAIQSSLVRVVAAAARLTTSGDVTLTVHPDLLVIDGKAPSRPDAAIVELASLFHDRLIGSLTIDQAADARDWHALLGLLGRTPDDLMGGGGIGKAWVASGRDHFEIREIDYAEVLRERAGGDKAEWSRIIAHCLQSDAATLDDRAIASMIEVFRDPARLREFIDTLQETPDAGGATIGARAAALIQLLRRALEVASKRGPQEAERILETVADAAPRLTPEMMLALAGERTVVDRMGDARVASFVANSVVNERGATERLAQAFQALVAESEHQERLLELAKAEASETPLGAEGGFEELWQSAASMLTSYTDEKYVSADYGRELSGARTQAIEVDRVSDDPPERVQEWLASVSDSAVRQLDLSLLQDLLRLENEPSKWEAVATTAVVEVERRVLLGEVSDAQRLVDAIVTEKGEGGREGLASPAESALNQLASGPLVRNIVTCLRKSEEGDADPLNRLCQAIGPRIARPLAESLAVEDNDRVILRLRELLLAFGAAGRQSVERLKNSMNPAVRRMAIDLLRVFGGREALPELASMLDDADPQVQRESIRAIVQIATHDAYAVLERALVAGSTSRDTVLQELIGLRDDKVIPLLCYVLTHTAPRGKLVAVHARIIEALGGLSAHKESTRTLRTVLHRGEWWAPYRTAALRQAAATALRRIGAPETLEVLEDAVAHGSRGVRHAARAQIGLSARRERARS
ncbi:MAG TPA: HEAT repeat domain-containing protein [Vicinamibacterales bacterium]